MSGKGSILSLPDELLVMIFQFLMPLEPDSSQEWATPFRHSCLVCRRLRSAAQALLFSIVAISLPRQAILLMRTLWEQPHLRNHVRDIEIGWTADPKVTDFEKKNSMRAWEQIAHAMPSLSDSDASVLRRIDEGSGFRVPTLTRLSSLHGFMGLIPPEGISDSAFSFVQLSLTSRFCGRPFLEKLLNASPRLKRLHLDCTMMDEGSMPVSRLETILGDKCPQLEELRVTNLKMNGHVCAPRMALDKPLRLPKLRKLEITTWHVGYVLPAQDAREFIGLGAILPPSIEYFRFVNLIEKYPQPYFPVGYPFKQISDWKRWEREAVATWATVAVALREGRLPNLAHGFFLTPEHGCLPEHIVAVEEKWIEEKGRERLQCAHDEGERY
ncbi:hypothetical protein ACHAQA_005827 [Verticillium albo-atrum]